MNCAFFWRGEGAVRKKITMSLGMKPMFRALGSLRVILTNIGRVKFEEKRVKLWQSSGKRRFAN